MKKSNQLVYFWLFVLILVSSCGNQQDQSLQSELVNVGGWIAYKQKVVIPVISTGTLVSTNQSNLSFMTGGVIGEIFVREGSIVKRGELLARLDLTEIDSRHKQARLAMDKAERDFTRAGNLYRDTVISLEMYQNAKTAFELAESNLRIASFAREHSVIKAPADGKILYRLKGEKEVAAPGHPVFVFASTEDAWVMKLKLSDRDAVQLSAGDSVMVHFDAYPGEKFRAELSFTGNVADPITGTFEAEVRLLQKPEKLVSGLIGEAELFSGSVEAFLIPAGSLIQAEGMEGTVYVLRENVPAKQRIKIQAVTSEGIVVTEGIHPSDTLISEGWQRVKPGRRIKITF